MISRTYEPLKFLGRLFLVPLRILPGTPLVSRTFTWEVDGDHRRGPTVVVKFGPLPYGVGIGWWTDSDVNPDLEMERRLRQAQEEEAAAYDMYIAVNGPVSYEEFSAARKEIAALGLGPDEEMAAMQEMGVFE